MKDKNKNMTITEFTEQFESLKIPILGVRLPSFKIEDKYKKALGLDSDAKNSEFLRALCIDGFKNMKLEKGSKLYNEYGERIKMELTIFDELGFTDYILLVWDILNFCKESNIPTGLGRGSAAGSLVLYMIGVTKIDPLKYGLYFERFVSKIRAKKVVIDGITYLDGSLAPDVDIDVCYYNRHKVLKYLEDKFMGRTSKILTFNTLSSKLVIKEVGKIFGSKSEEEMTNVTSMIPKVHGQLEDLDKAYEKVKEFKEWCDTNNETYEIAQKLKDLIKNKGVHPSGVMISYDKLEDICPIELSSDKDLVSSFDMNQVSLFSLKVDILGLRGVSVVDDVCKMLNLKIEEIDLNHPSIYKALQNLKYPHGLFQIEADLGFRTTQKVKPHNFSELSAILALARPGAMQFIDKYADFTNGGEYDSIHPFFDDILKETSGVAIYQEQLMKMAHKIGFTLDEAEILRRIVGKKKLEEVKAWQSKIQDKVKENKLDPKISDILWKILNDSASYSFNKSHSAAYAALSAISVYLKFNYPKEFYLSLLKMTKHEPDPINEISKIHKEMQYFGIELLPPSLVVSDMDFAIEDKGIRFGLSSIKGISEKTLEKFNNFKRKYANKFELFESANQAGLNIGVVSSLVQAGTLEQFGSNRVFLVYEAQLWNVLTEKEKKLAMQYGPKFEFKLPTLVQAMVKELKDEKSKFLIKESRFETIKKKMARYKEIYEKNNQCQDFANWWYEKSLMGYSTKARLIDIFRPYLKNLKSINEILGEPEKIHCSFVGIVDDNASLGKSKQGSDYAKYSISDETGVVKVLIFNKRLAECKEFNKGLPKAKDIVIVKGQRMGDDAVFADAITIQQNKIYTKLSELKEASA